MRLVSWLSMVLFLLAFAGLAAAADGPGTATVRQANTTLAALLKKEAAAGSTDEARLAAEVTEKLQSFLDVDELGHRALADHWQDLDEGKRAEFTKLLRDIVQKSYVKALRSRLHYGVAYDGEKTQGGNLLVTTRVLVDKQGTRQEIGVDYLLRRDGDHLRVYDLVTDGVGLVENYRAEFNKVIKREGFAGLLDRMRKKATG